MTDDLSPRRPPRRASSPAGEPVNGRTEEPAPSTDAAAVGEPTVVESHEVPAETAVLHSPAEGAGDPGPAHRADAPVDVPAQPVDEPAAEPSAPHVAAVPASSAGEAAAVREGAEPTPTAEPAGGAAAAPERSTDRRAEPRSERAAEREQPTAAVAAVPVESAPPAETRRPEAEVASETSTVSEPRPEERNRPADAAAVVAPVSPVPAPSAPVAESETGPVSAPPAPRTVYVDSPIAPKKKGNRGFGVLMAVLATIVYALVWAGVAALIIAFSSTSDRFVQSFGNFVVSPAYWGPVLVFALAMIVLSLIVNRGGWAWWIIGGFVVAVVVYFGYLGSALLTVANQITAADVGAFVTRVALTPLAIGSAVAAREVAIWFGAAAASRGRKVKVRNAETRANFDKEQAERKAEAERARAGYAAADS